MNLLAITILFSFISCESTPEEAGRIARRILTRSKMGIVSTIMTNKHGVESFPYASMEYISDSCDKSGDPFIFLVSWGTHGRNIQASSNVSLFIQDTEYLKHPTPDDRGPMDHTRFSLFGNIHPISPGPSYNMSLECFLETHDDARQWKDAHDFVLYHLSVKSVNFIGGFGDEHYVGWLTSDQYHNSHLSFAIKRLRVQVSY